MKLYTTAIYTEIILITMKYLCYKYIVETDISTLKIQNYMIIMFYH